LSAHDVTVQALLAEARALGVERLDAQVLIASHLDRSRTWLLAHAEAGVDLAVATRTRSDFKQRARGVPLAYLVGRREFYGLDIRVTPATLVPRPETETLVDWALELVSEKPTEVVDLGTGSGAIALAIKALRPASTVVATDSSADALEVARANAAEQGLAVEFTEGSWWEPLAGRRFGLAVSNPPYIDAGDPHLEALRAEPLTALTPGEDGMAAIRTIIANAARHLRHGAFTLLEHGHSQAAEVRMLLARNGFDEISTRRDLSGHERVTGGRWAG
jgi:release factor glutamine methyltransferase